MSAPRSTGRIERYGPGDAAPDPRPGDIILTHRRRRLMPALIAFAQRRRFTGPRRVFAHWSHCALVVAPDGTLVEAESRGVIRSPLDKYRANEYHLVRMDDRLDDEQRRTAASVADACVGDAFGYAVLCSLMIWLVTGMPVRWHRRDHQICSGLVATALERAGQRFARPPAFMLPADLAETFWT
jgi:hypothetical protein